MFHVMYLCRSPRRLPPQNVGGGTAVAQVRATDRDVGLNSVLSYYITRGNEDLTFRMDRVTGEIATRPSPPDRERQSFYSLVVTVEDEGNPSLSVSHRNVLFGGRMELGSTAGASLALRPGAGKRGTGTGCDVSVARPCPVHTRVPSVLIRVMTQGPNLLV